MIKHTCHDLLLNVNYLLKFCILCNNFKVFFTYNLKVNLKLKTKKKPFTVHLKLELLFHFEFFLEKLNLFTLSKKHIA